MMNKRELRNRSREIRDFMPAADRERLDNAIEGHLLGWKIYRESRSVFCYVSFRSEASTSGILHAALASGKTLSVPRVSPEENEMRAFVVRDLERDLKPGFYGIPEPLPHCPETVLIDLVIAPGLAFTRGGDRLGYGGGFYDRFIHNHRNITICGITYDSCLVEALPVKEHDRGVDYLITESGVRMTVRGENG
jgi:5-formyltetrahydrofolate cyclo-ligase